MIKEVFIVIFTSIAVGLFALYEQTIFLFVTYLLLLTLVLVLRYKSIAVKIFCLNILFNLLLNRIYIYEYGEPYFMGGSDDKLAFEGVAEYMLGEYGLNLFDFIYNGFIFHNSILYVYIVAIFMRFGNFFDGYYTIAPIFFNTYLLTLIAKKFYKICHIKYGLNREKATKLTYCFAFFPLIMFMNSHVFRDTLVNYLMISIVSLVVFRPNYSGLKIILVILVISLLRIEYSAIFAVLLIVRYIWLFSVKQILEVKCFIIFSTICLLSFFLFKYSYILSFTLGTIEMYDSLRIENGNPMVQRIFSLPLPLRIPAKFIFLLLNPSPSFGTLEQMFIGLGTIIQALITPWVFYGIYIGLKKKDFIALLFIIMFLVIGLVSVDAKHKYSLIMLGILPTYYGFQKLKLKF